jgi:hypothetical protein
VCLVYQALRALDAEVSGQGGGGHGSSRGGGPAAVAVLANVGGKALGVMEGLVKTAGKVSRITMKRTSSKKRKEKEDKTTRDSDKLMWVAVVRLADDIKSTVRRQREELRVSQILAETLLHEISNIMEVGSNTQTTFADLMPSLNTAISWITREYKVRTAFPSSPLPLLPLRTPLLSKFALKLRLCVCACVPRHVSLRPFLRRGLCDLALKMPPQDPKKVLNTVQGLQLIQLFLKLASDICVDALVQSHTHMPGTPQAATSEIRPTSSDQLKSFAVRPTPYSDAKSCES